MFSLTISVPTNSANAPVMCRSPESTRASVVIVILISPCLPYYALGYLLRRRIACYRKAGIKRWRGHRWARCAHFSQQVCGNQSALLGEDQTQTLGAYLLREKSPNSHRTV